jgi:3-oxoacyl-[acyl-carrier-protein] synthase-3
LVLADRLAYTYGHVLVVAAERMSDIAQRQPVDRNVAILFGDGAGAALVSPHEGQIAVIGHVIHSDGSFEKDLHLDCNGPLKMDGLTVILQSSRKLPAAILEVLDKTGYTPTDVEAFILHQANQNLTIRIARSLRVSEQRFVSNIHKYGNTSSASMLIAATEWMYNASIPQDGLVMFAAFGAGFHWGALIGRRSSNKSATAAI